MRNAQCGMLNSEFSIDPGGLIVDDTKLKEMITEKLENGSLSCQDAHLIAEKLGVHLSLVGKACNEEGSKIKITQCLLGCF